MSTGSNASGTKENCSSVWTKKAMERAAASAAVVIFLDINLEFYNC